MVSSTVDDTVAQYFASCIDVRKPIEVGVLVGRAAGGKALLLHAAPTPDQDDSPPASLQQGPSGGGSASNHKKQGKAKAQPAAGGGMSIDKEWVVEHALQVSSLLPGGLDVVGLYLLCPEGTYGGASALLLSLLHEAQLELKGLEPLLLLHVDAVTGKLSAREFTGGAAGSLKPCELKTANLLGSIVAVHCRLDTAIDVQLADPKQRVRDVLSAAVERHLEQSIVPAVGLLAGALQPAETPLLDIDAGEGAATVTTSGDGQHDLRGNGGSPAIPLELLLPPAAAGLPAMLGGGPLQRGRGRQETVAALHMAGVLDCRAFLQKREPASAAVEAIKQDAARTLRARVRLLVDLAEQQREEAEAAAADAAEQAAAGATVAEQRPPLLRRVGDAPTLAAALPRRAFVAAPGGAFCYCDHLVDGEEPAHVLGRMEELLGVQLANAAGAVQCMELAQAAGQLGRHGKGAAAEGRGSSPSAYCNVAAASAAAVAGLALLIGYWSIMQ